VRGGVAKVVDVDKAIADLGRVFEEDGKDEALTIVRGMLETLLRRNAELELDKMRLLKKHLGKTSERISKEQLAFLFELLPKEERPADTLVPAPDASLDGDASDESANDEPKAKKRSKHGRKPLPDALRREDIELPVPEEERACLLCGKERVCIGHETTERLQFKPAEFFVERLKREKLACDACEKDVSTAPVPPAVTPKSRAGASTLARIVVGKYEDHEPLNRQKKMFERLGVSLPVSTLADWVGAAAHALEPIADLIRKLVVESHVLHADDTGLKVLDEKAPGGAKKGHLWFYVGDATLCAVQYTPDWTKAGPGLFLAARRGGWLVADAYKGYDHIFSRDESPPIEVGCWAHARRPFVELADRGEPRVATMLLYVKKLYEIERASKEACESAEQRLARRRAESAPLIAKIGRWCTQNHGTDPPESAFTKAIGYVVNQWRALTRFLEDGALPLDNTIVERALRGVGVGRRNYLFAGSDRGAARAATLYTIIATCKLCGVEPMAYVTDVLSRIESGTFKHGDLRDVLPDKWRETAPPSAMLAPAR
jgi:transposase